MSQESDKRLEVVLWGASQAGKTTALAAYLCDTKKPPPWLDRSDPMTRGTLEVLGQTWNELRRNLMPKSTVRFHHYDVRGRGDTIVRFRDMMGDNTRRLSLDDSEALAATRAPMLFVEWSSTKTVFDKMAVEKAIRIIRDDAHVALVITKVEWFLTPLKLREFMADPLRVASELKLRRDFIDILELVHKSNIFAISVYGHSPNNNYPAHYRDEFGRLVPWGIRPINVASPFEHVLHPLI